MECGETRLLQRLALRKFRLTDTQTTRDQITRMIKLRCRHSIDSFLEVHLSCNKST